MNRGAVPTYPEYKKQYLSGGDGDHVKVIASDGDLILVSGTLDNATFLHRDAPSELLPNEVTDLKDSVLAGGTISDIVVDGKMGIHKLHLVLQRIVSDAEHIGKNVQCTAALGRNIVSTTTIGNNDDRKSSDR